MDIIIDAKSSGAYPAFLLFKEILFLLNEDLLWRFPDSIQAQI